MTYIAPKVFENKFTCPHCGAISLHRWNFCDWDFKIYNSSHNNNPIKSAMCVHCEKFSLWIESTMIYPDIGCAPQPNPDLPKLVIDIYWEAASISTKSPRGAAALLRLAVQLLCKELGEKGNNINEDIAGLVKKGLPDRVQQALDIVRVTGNNAVHPGQVDIDDVNVVARLFELINVIAEYTLSMPNRIKGVYDNLPQSAVEQIKKRDNKKNGTDKSC